MQDAAVHCSVTYVYEGIEEKGWPKVWYWRHSRLHCNVLSYMSMHEFAMLQCVRVYVLVRSQRVACCSVLQCVLKDGSDLCGTPAPACY